MDRYVSTHLYSKVLAYIHPCALETLLYTIHSTLVEYYWSTGVHILQIAKTQRQQEKIWKLDGKNYVSSRASPTCTPIRLLHNASTTSYSIILVPNIFRSSRSGCVTNVVTAENSTRHETHRIHCEVTSPIVGVVICSSNILNTAQQHSQVCLHRVRNTAMWRNQVLVSYVRHG
jgi:hypothetical protein